MMATAGLLDRHDGLSPVHAAREESAHGRDCFRRRRERVGSIVWAGDNRTLFYTVEDEEQKRQFQLYPARCGHTACARMCWSTRRRMSASTSARAARATASTSCWKRPATRPAKSRFLAADAPEGEWTLIQPREDDLEYYADHRNGTVLHSHKRWGQEFSAGDGAGGAAGPRELDGDYCRIART